MDEKALARKNNGYVVIMKSELQCFESGLLACANAVEGSIDKYAERLA